MYNIKEKDILVNQFIENADLNYDVFCSYGSLYHFMESGDNINVKNMINGINDVFYNIAGGIEGFPKVSVLVTLKGETSISQMDITMKNKNKSSVKFKMKKCFVLTENVLEELISFFKSVYVELLVDTLVRDNLKLVNELLEKICKDANLEYKVSVTSALSNEGRKIASITDEEVVYVADEEKALTLEGLVLFADEEVVSPEVVEEQYKQAVVRFAEAQTTVQFVGVSEPILRYICGFSSLVKPFTLIKKVHSKNIKNLRGNKESLYYYNEDGIYSIIKVDEEGNKTVVLKPFDISTLEVVDVDVLA